MRRIVCVIGVLLLLAVALPVGAVVWHFWQWGARLPDRAEIASMTLDAPLCDRDASRPTAPLSNIPKTLVDAFLADSDKNFWNRPPYNPLLDLARLAVFHAPVQSPGMTTALARRITSCARARQGISGTRGWHESFAIMSYRVDRELTKSRILELYLNDVYFGRGADGVVAAADMYFGKPVSRLTLGECAFLAVLPRSPNYYGDHTEAAMARRGLVLDQMAAHGDIDVAEAEAAKVEALVFRARPAR